MDALIGCTGFVGGNLARQRNFDKKYSSTNIDTIAGQEFDTVVCAGVPGTKWLANKYPRQDLAKINLLLCNLAGISCQRFVLISTVDVYCNPVLVNEDTPLTMASLHPYGQHRILVEQFVQEHFSTFHIIRLPALFGLGLKKNFVYDLLHQHCLDWTHRDSVFQYYYLQHLWRDIEIVLAADIPLVNFTTEPISARDLAKECFSLEFTNITPQPPLVYDVGSIWTSHFSAAAYMYTREQVLKDLAAFIAQQTRDPR